MSKLVVKSSLLKLSVEEENLAAIPFAVLERRVGKKINKIEIQGTKVLPDGTEVLVSWQVQGNNDLGLPTEQDLDIFVALGVITFQNNFAKTVSFTGRDIAKILGIHSVHGKFYKRLKIAMDRFISLRFRGIAASDRQEDVKWVNVFQEASFSLDRKTGRCIGAVTWTDKLIESMNNGFFRVLDAGRYMEIDGITGKHLYRFLVLAFEKTDLIIIDARKLATEHLGIINPPRYFSRLMQTLEPAFEQLIRIGVLGSFCVVRPEEWEIALRRHGSYVPERKVLISHEPEDACELRAARCVTELERAGLQESYARSISAQAKTAEEFHQLERAVRLLELLVENSVLPHVAQSLIRRALDSGVESEAMRDALDWCEIGIELIKQKRAAGQSMRNAAGLLVKIAKGPETARTLVPEAFEAGARRMFRQREQTMKAQQELAERRALIFEYEQFRESLASNIFQDLPDTSRSMLRREKAEILRQQGRFDKMDNRTREVEIDQLIVQDIARREAPPFEKWYARKRTKQAILPLEM